MYNFRIKIGNVQMMYCPVDITVYYFLNGIIVLFVCLMMSNATFKNISAISWRSVLLMEEARGPRENPRPVTDKLYHIMLYTSLWSRFELTTSVVIGTDFIGSCKSNYHTIMAMTAPKWVYDLHIRNNTILQIIVLILNVIMFLQAKRKLRKN
jgi:hypothetical protein